MAPLALTGVLSAASKLPLAPLLSLLQMGSGIFDKYKAHELAQTPRPEMTTPPELKELLANARMNAAQPNLPGMEDALSGKTAEAAGKLQRVAPSSASLLGGVADVYGKELNTLANSRMDYYKDAQQNLNSALGSNAQATQNNWQWNVGQPYLQAIGTAGRLENTGRQDIFNGLNTASNYQQLMAMMKMLKDGDGGPVSDGTISTGPAPK